LTTHAPLPQLEKPMGARVKPAHDESYEKI